MADTRTNILTTSNAGFVLPTNIADGVWKKTQDTSVLARLAGQMPQKFGTTNVMTLTGTPRAELVGESVEKSPTGTKFGNKTVVPYKLQVTMRTSQEVQWADEDYQMGVFTELMNQCGIALGRALDLVGIHKINPLTGTVSANVSEGLVDCTNVATFGDKTNPDVAIENAAHSVIVAGYSPSGIAFDDTLSFALATQRDKNGVRIYPELGLGKDVTGFMGLNAAVGNTVSGAQELKTASDIRGIVGNFDAFKWGVQRDIKAHLITAGDPDGQGDLNRTNEVAIRAEIVYGIGIMDKDAFCLVKDETVEPVTSTE